MARFIEPVTNQNERCFRCYCVFYKFQSVIFNIFFHFFALWWCEMLKSPPRKVSCHTIMSDFARHYRVAVSSRLDLETPSENQLWPVRFQRAS